MIPTCITHMVARQQQQQLVACNIYVSSGGKKLHHKTVLLDTLFKAQERCRLICKGLITPSCDCSSLSPLLREDERHQEETGKITSSSLLKHPSENPRVAIVHAYSDGPYNRSSFHLAGDANCVADIALFMALSTLEGLLSPPSQKISSFNNHNSLTIEDNQHANNHNFLKLDDFVDNNSTHPYIGIVDHISVMPLVARLVSELSSDNFRHDISTSNNNSNPSPSQPQSQPQGDDHCGKVATYVGKKLKDEGIEVHYYGSADIPDGKPLAIVRKEKTNFFHSGGLSIKNNDRALLDKVNYSSSQQHDWQTNLSSDNKKLILGSCTIGSPPTFVENFNIQLSSNCSRKMAMSLTRRIRERDDGDGNVGIQGVEALTLPYSNGRYEIACNLLLPRIGSSIQIMRSLDDWIKELRQIYDFNKKEEIKDNDFNISDGECNMALDKSYFVDRAYLVGTTENQCQLVLQKINEDDEIGAHDISVGKSFEKNLCQDL